MLGCLMIQVEVVALPYYKSGKLVECRYLQLSEGQLVASWLAEAKNALYMRDEAAVQVIRAFCIICMQQDASWGVREHHTTSWYLDVCIPAEAFEPVQ